MSLTFNQLKYTNWERCLSWHDPFSWSIAEWTNALCGEAGEAANFAKKLKRLEQELVGPNEHHNNTTKKELIENIGKELADVVIYADLIASTLGLDLGSLVRSKFNETSNKYEFKQKL